MSVRSIILLVLAAALILVASTGLFTVRETQQVIVMQFGDPRRVVKEPGLHWKIPFLQQANYFDSRILNLDIPAQEVIASDQKRLEVDAFARFRITDPLLTYQTVRNELGAKSRIQTIMASNLRQVLASEPLRTIVSGERSRLMTTIRDSVNANAKRFGIDVVDMRLRRVDLPEANSKTIFERMRTEREREAEEARAEGRELAARIRAQADRERTVLLAEASRDAQKLRGEGDGSAVKIFADAFGKDVDFFEFYRTMEAYRNSLKGSSTTVILSPDSEYLGYLRGSEKKN
ncbi:protein HflC [Iodidimonas muriae]|uniref:Protein HflC n=1 Tax=Iodidimonas muriae TaxID=261467 RepID=A0ABQ2L5F0_9PROT|nr:protease modulator HflC [Iodidimonas muriae]GER06278.1 protein HflC [Kordiimonadales bacterium JCM 17843]GGO04109.1 protein HflC [Iodidimonas muriae]